MDELEDFCECCETCEYWFEKYHQCEHPEQLQSESGAYMAPPHKYCGLWENSSNCPPKEAAQ